jgi:hypothetical protein
VPDPKIGWEDAAIDPDQLDVVPATIDARTPEDDGPNRIGIGVRATDTSRVYGHGGKAGRDIGEEIQTFSVLTIAAYTAWTPGVRRHCAAVRCNAT